MTGPRRVLPGFGLSLGWTLSYLSFIVLIPLAALASNAGSLGWEGWQRVLVGERALAAYRVTFGAALLAASLNTIFGLVIAWILVRYQFPFRRLLDAIVDLPFALPAAVGGIALTAIYATNGPIGSYAYEWFGWRTAYSLTGVVLAMAFVSFPFVIRTVEPVLRELDPEVEEAARSLRAGPARIFFSVILPQLVPALLAGFSLCLARGIGEYGAVIFMSQNLPMLSEVASQLIVVRVEEPNLPAAAGIAMVLLALAFAILLVVNALQAWSARGRRTT
jgi:sulfate transport system permease protein